MNRVLIPSDGPDSWRRFLAQPDTQWRTGYSARTIAHAWEAANGFPPEVAAILEATLGPTDLLFAIPEHKTPLPGGRRESQSDVFAIGRYVDGLVTCTIEGKVDEPFGPTVGEWFVDASPGKAERLGYICHLLGVRTCPPEVHYQLLHRTASALIEADRFHARDAAMIVHSFSPERRWFEAYARFVALLGAAGTNGGTAVISLPDERRLILGWAHGNLRYRSA